MNYTMHRPVEGCAHVMAVAAQTDDEAVAMLITAGDTQIETPRGSLMRV